MWYWYRAHCGREVSRKWLVLSFTMIPEEPEGPSHTVTVMIYESFPSDPAELRTVVKTAGPGD